MRNKKIALFALLSIFVLNSAFSHGQTDIEEIEVENLNSWQESFDLEGKDVKKATKYNIVINATDLSGNVHTEGPYNLFIDPDSDLPICSITNPSENMRVAGNLNIVGTCVDDDAVSYVELVFDGDTDHPIRADGTEFWSFYLDTVNLSEGPHVIKVTGYDINGLPSKPVTLHWQLDRNMPVTSVQDRTMGMLVSGKINFKGTVTDGNGIKELFYSVDNGEYFYPVKLTRDKQNSGNCGFELSVDTKKFKDGPSVIWFKAIDNAGSEGHYSFLYFIDNTPPDVEIVYPTHDDEMNGKFTVAGFAKDTIGITALSWSFGEEKGDFELIPGNPYWSVNVDTTGAVKEKSRKFTIHAVDKVGNVVDKSLNISLNQESDKPTVSISEPAVNQIFNGDDELVYVRGIASDDDGVKAIKIQLDSGEPIIQSTKGVFYQELGKASDLSAGNHKIIVTAIDVNDIEGNPFVVQISSKGVPPVFNNPVISKGKETVEFQDGMEIHPEGGNSFVVTVASDVGIKAVHTTFNYGKNGIQESDVELKNVSSYNVTLPITSTSPLGLVQFTVEATDAIDRVSEATYYMYITNTSVIKTDTPAVLFEDSTVAEDGSILSNPAFPVTGYFIGGTIASAAIVPETPFAKLDVKGNLLKLIPNPKEIGSSEPVVVAVTTEDGNVYESRPLIFRYDNVLPTLKLDNHSEEQALDGTSGSVKISGSVTCKTGVGGVSYRVLGVKAEMSGGIIKTVSNSPEIPFTSVSVDEEGKFNIFVNTTTYIPGMYVVEVVAQSAGGNKVSKAVAISTIPPIPPSDGKPLTPKAPVISWLDGMDVYAVGVYQGKMDRNFFVFPRDKMVEGANPCAAEVTPEGGKMVAGKFTANKAPTLDAHFAQVNGLEYYSGMKVSLPYGSQKTIENNATVYIDTGATVTGVTYEISGAEVPGGDLVQKGTAKLTKPLAGETRWIAEIPLNNLPSRVNYIDVTVKAGGMEQTIRGTISVVRNVDSYLVEDTQQLFYFADKETIYNKESETWVLSNGSKYYIYANLVLPIKAELDIDMSGLELTKGEQEKFFTISATKDALYGDAKVIFTDGLGITYETPALNFLADNEAPEVYLQTPTLHQWVNSYVQLTGTVADSLGVKKVEYSFDNGLTWRELELLASDNNSLGVTFNSSIDISNYADGLFEVTVRAIDNAGHITTVNTACFKDTTPPKATVIVPLADDIVNGETQVVFKIEDNGCVTEAQYVMENPEDGSTVTQNMELNHLSSLLIGTEELPIDDSMNFAFTDEAGNKGIVSLWNFKIDNESDLPRAEIHVPEEMAVVTRDFTISGVVYDDDGDSTIWYKIDDGEYVQIPELNTSFSIDIPIITLSDNEHTITVYAVDINGVKGEETTRTFRVSLEEPKGEILLPTIETSVSNVITFSGVASDRNGIAKVELSLDNGNSYNDAEGTEEWEYVVDTRAIPGGTSVVFLRITDNYGIVGLYSSLVNIDNDCPDISIDLPLDDSTTTGQLFFSGYAFDNVEITRMYVTIRNMDEASEAVVRDLKVDYIIGETIDITDLSNGYYNIQITGEDNAGNKTNVSRNIHLDKTMPPAQVDILYPLNGEHKKGNFNIYGQAASNLESPIRSLRLFVDDIFVKETELSNTGYFKFFISPDAEIETGEFDEDGHAIKVPRPDMTEGPHFYRVDAVLENGQQVSSRSQLITYEVSGPWVTLDNFIYGDFAINRPYIKGTAGYTHTQEEIAKVKAKDAKKEDKAIYDTKSVASIEISFDNGKTYEQISKNEKWQYRIENEDLPEGYHFVLIRATMKDGETAIERFIIQVDNTAPTVRLISPSNGGRYNQRMEVSGLSQDDVKLQSVKVALRKGDKAAYELPSFVQGLYLDFRMFGATFFDFGAGLTFFDDNVKLQLGWGQFTQNQFNIFRDGNMRYGGNNILSVKILANISTIPFSYFLGRDWDWLYASFAIGAEFARFNETNSGQPQILSSLLGQIEFPRIYLDQLKYFRTFSIYTEGSLWFIPTDIASGGGVKVNKLVPKLSVGLRANVF